MSASPKRIDPSIIAAFIGVCGTLTVAVFSIFAPQLFSQQTSTPFPTTVFVITATDPPTAIPTDTVPPGDATSTPAPDTPTPVPTFSFTPIPAPLIGTDWVTGCISALWVPYYPSSTLPEPKDGCLPQPVDKFVANSGRLAFLYDDRVSTAEVHGLFALLPADGTASVKVLLKDLEKGEIWMGIFSAPDINSAGMILTIPPGNINRRPIVQISMPLQERILESINFQQDPPVYDVFFSFNTSSVEANIMNNSLTMNPFALTSAQKWLFIGYQVKNGANRIGAEFYDLVVQPR